MALNQENKSPYIDPDKCRDCGECCKHFSVFYPRATSTAKEISDMHLIHLRTGMETRIIEVEDGWWLEYQHPCRYLKKSRDEGYRCRAYGSPSRPPICGLFPYEDTPLKDCPHKTAGETPETPSSPEKGMMLPDIDETLRIQEKLAEYPLKPYERGKLYPEPSHTEPQEKPSKKKSGGKKNQ